MSILVNGMEMPKDKSLWLCIHPDGTVYNIKPDHGGGRQGKAVFIPPHGRCIDADKVRQEIDEKRLGRSYEDAWALTVIDAADTVMKGVSTAIKEVMR